VIIEGAPLGYNVVWRVVLHVAKPTESCAEDGAEWTC
jgi:hypothetical protein